MIFISNQKVLKLYHIIDFDELGSEIPLKLVGSKD